ncbi:MAG: DUF4249 domain-containing protein [Bacteroidota bacterium]|nr:DUF4249 domain-containing protein [Bacteroidota bacterium]
MKNIYFALIFVTTAFFFSCEKTEDIDDFPLVTPQLVLNCMFSPDSSWEFQLSKSLSVLDNAEIEYLKNATVKLYKNNQLINTITETNKKTFYVLQNNTAEFGAKYKVEISRKGYKDISSTSTLPTMVEISGLTKSVKDSSTYWSQHGTWGELTGHINVKFNDSKAGDNYYMLSIFSIDTNTYYNYPDTTISYQEININYHINDETDNPAIEIQSEQEYIFSDKYFSGQSIEISAYIEDWNFTPNKTFVVVLYSLSREAYLYKRSLALYYERGENPFSEPVQVYGNIENGFGIFGGYTMDVKSITF